MRNFRLKKVIRQDIIISIILLTIITLLIGSTGNPFAWHNKREKPAAIFSRLDRAVVNHLWIKLYQISCVEPLPILSSNHMPPYLLILILGILIDTHTRHRNSNCASSKFETKWLLDKDFLGLVSSVWSTSIKGSYAYQLTRKLIFLNKKSKKET